MRLNQQEIDDLSRQCDIFDTENEGAVIKLCWRTGWNVLQSQLGVDTLKWLSRRDRVRQYGAKGED